jgi:hypothetical protein
MSHMISFPFVAPEQRLTSEMRQRLEELAPLFQIEVTTIQGENNSLRRLSGPGFSEPEPLVLSADEATIRLLAEICSILTRWVAFSPLEPCEVTLFALSHERLERCAGSFRKQLAQQARAAEEAAAAKQVREVLSTLKEGESTPAPQGPTIRPGESVLNQ